MIPIKIQKNTESVEEAIDSLEKATLGKNFNLMILIQTQDNHSTLFANDTNVKIIKHPNLEIKNCFL